MFPSKKDTYIWPSNFSRTFEQLRDKLNLNHITPHALRHTFATRLLELNEDMRVIQELLGGPMADIYAHVAEKLKRQAVNKLDDVLGTTGTKENEKEPPRAPNGHQKALRRIK